MLTENAKELTTAASLDTTHGSIASRTDEGVYSTLVRAQSFLLEYFNYIGYEVLLEHVLVKMLNDSLAESFFGHMSELTVGNNLTYLQMAWLMFREAFHYLWVYSLLLRIAVCQ